MTTTEIVTAFTLAGVLIIAWIAVWARVHPHWLNSRPRHLILLARIELRLRKATLPKPGLLRASMPATHTRPGRLSEPAMVTLAYSKTDPYAVRLIASSEGIIRDHTFARDLFIAASTFGGAGEGRVRVYHTRGFFGVTIDPHARGSETFILPEPQVHEAIDSWLEAVPLDSETIDMDAALTRLLNTAA